MKKLRSLIVADVVLSLVIIITVLVYKFAVMGETPGIVILSFLAVISFNLIFCIFSLLALSRKQHKLVLGLWIFVISLFVFYFMADFIGGSILLHTEDKNPPEIESDPLEHKFIEGNYAKLLSDSVVHHRLPKNAVMRMYYPDDFDVRVNTDKTGFRTMIDSKEKDSTKIRILMLGDSFTFGEGVKNDQTSSYLLENYLNESSVNKYEVINLGVSSYAPILEYLQLKENIRIMEPDIVIMNFDMSDLVQEYVYRKKTTFGEDSEPLAVDGSDFFTGRRESYKARVTNWIYNHLFITTSILEFLRRQSNNNTQVQSLDVEDAVMRKTRTVLLHTIKDADFKEFDICMSMIEDSILRMKKLCDEYGAEFILTTYPWGHQVSDTEWTPGRYGFLPKSFEISDRTVNELTSFSIANGITFFNAFPYFRRYKGKEPLYYNHDMHFTPEGQELMARFLYENLPKYLKQH